MLKKYISKFAMDILPSVAATIIGAYIVNHYIVTKPGANAPVAAAVSSTEPKAEAKVAPDGAKAAETSADVANIPEPGVKAKGISERSVLEKSAIEKPPEKSADKAEKPADKAEKPADKPAETASIPVETRRHQPAPREKAIAKAVPAPVQPSAPVAAPVVAAPTTAPAVEAAIAPEEHRDANDLARAAIERLRGASDGSPRAQEAARIPDPARVPDTPRVVAAPVGSAPVVAAPPVRPLPPPIMVSTPTPETFNSAAGSSEIRSSYPAAAGIEDPRRPTPPADIPSSPSPASRPPLDLHADAREPPPREHTTVAEDVLSAAKSVFHAVLPR
jgi:hypothetical protein